ncbi:MAG: NUDIX hydrolase [Balneolaceae bacterium]
MRHIDAGGGVVFRLDRGVCSILLIHRRGVWDLPKGKLETGESIEECALREVEEETGAHPLTIVSSLETTRHIYSENGNEIEKTTFWYAMKHTGELHDLSPQEEEQINGLAWVSPEEALNRVGYENLKTVLRRFNKKGYGC